MHDGFDGFNDVNVYLHFRIKKNQIKYIHDCATLKGLIWFSSCYKSGQMSIVIISYNSKYEFGFLFKFHHKIVWKMLTTLSNHCLLLSLLLLKLEISLLKFQKGLVTSETWSKHQHLLSFYPWINTILNYLHFTRSYTLCMFTLCHLINSYIFPWVCQ